MLRLYILLVFIGLLSTAFADDQPLSEKSWSHYGSLSKSYSAGRKGYPDQVYTILKTYVPTDSYVLDVGSGTGISSRELAKHGFDNIIGIDRDEEMVKEAEANQAYPIHYLQLDVTKGLVFEDNSFDLITSFAAFHWFSNPASVQEIYRLLKLGGYFFVVGPYKPVADSFREVAYAKIAEIIGRPLPDPRQGFDPATILYNKGFEIIVEQYLPEEKVYTKQEALAYLQSLSIWNIVKNSHHENDVKAMLSSYLDTCINEEGNIIMSCMQTVILAKKQAGVEDLPPMN